VRAFRFYGLDADLRVAEADQIFAADEADAKAKARHRLKEFSIIEVWEGTVLVLREQRREPTGS
jgi:hypothetical protein